MGQQPRLRQIHPPAPARAGRLHLLRLAPDAAPLSAPAYRADPPGALLTEPLDAFVAVFHRPSGATHLLVSPAPEILEVLAREALTLDALLQRLAKDYALVDADPDALAERVGELVEAGLVQAFSDSGQ